MWLWIVLIALVLGISLWVQMRFGRGARGGAFHDPVNEQQGSHPQKGPPLF